MRKPILALAVVGLLATACGGSAGGSPAASQGGAPPQHHVPTPEPWQPDPHPYPPDDDGAPPRATVPPYVDPDEDEVSTFGLDIDTASYALARARILAGGWPDASSIRVEEWVNAFEHDYPAPDESVFSIVADGGPTPFTEHDELLLRIGLRAQDVRDRQRDQASLTFVIDTSGSMERDGRLELVKDALRELVDGLRVDDRVGIVAFGDRARVILEPTEAAQDWRLHEAIETLWPGGSTNLEAGLQLGYDLARGSLTENGIDRVILASDGVANVGLTDGDGLLHGIRRDAAAGIELVSVGVGMGDYNDALLEQLANDGDGFYAYVDDPAEARRVFTEDLTGSLQAVALDARAQVEFDPEVVAAYRLVGYEDRAIDDHDFTDDDVPAGAIGAGHDVTALYAVRLREDADVRAPLAVVRLRWTDPARGDPDELSRQVRLGDLATRFSATDPTFRMDAIVAATAEILRGSQWSGRIGFRDVAAVADREVEDLPPTGQVHEFLDLLDVLARMEE